MVLIIDFGCNMIFDRHMIYVINNFGATTSLANVAEYFEKENIAVRTE